MSGTTTPDGAEDENGRRIRLALDFLAAHYRDQPSLAETASVAGLSPYHFQRLFSRRVGISPKKFLQHLSLETARDSLARNETVLNASLDAGLSGPGRLHDLFVTHEAISPGEWKSGAAGLELSYGWHPSLFGDCLIVASPRGVCGLGFATADGRAAALDSLRQQLDRARFVERPAVTAPLADRAFGRAGGNIHLVLRGTPFQIQVWRALLRIPPGQVASYSQIATAIGRPRARRAVGQACGINPVPWLIPCHRVLRTSGALWGYRWGTERKRLMLAWEAGRVSRLT